MAQLTVGQVFDKISETRSKIAVLHTLRTHLKANYLSSEANSAEMTMTREDNSIVPETHVHDVIDDLDSQITACRQELAEWEQVTVAPPEEDRAKRKKKVANADAQG